MGKGLKVGDTVKWWSSYKDKQGQVVVVLQPGATISRRDLEAGSPDCTASAIDGGSVRDHESYIVRVPSGTKAKDKLYWPRVSALELVSEF